MGEPLHRCCCASCAGWRSTRRRARRPRLVAGCCERVGRAYAEADQDRYLLERSQESPRQEMAELYAALQAERDRLEARVRERTDALQLSQARLASLVSLSSDWIWEQDEELRFTYFSDGLKQATGVEPAQLLGKRGC